MEQGCLPRGIRSRGGVFRRRAAGGGGHKGPARTAATWAWAPPLPSSIEIERPTDTRVLRNCNMGRLGGEVGAGCMES